MLKGQFRCSIVFGALAGLLFSSAPVRAVEPETPPEAWSRMTIHHDPLPCVTPDAAPLIEAKIEPEEDLESAVVYFRALGTKAFYSVRMEGTAAEMKGVLPRPLPETRAMEYFVETRDRRKLTRRVPEFAPPVLSSSVCLTEGEAIPAAGLRLTVGLTEPNQPSVPPGFNPADIARVIQSEGTIVSVADAAVSSPVGGAKTQIGSAARGMAGKSSGPARGEAGETAGALPASRSVLAAVGGSLIAAAAGSAIGSPRSEKNSKSGDSVPPKFVEADASWSGPGGVDLTILRDGRQVGQKFPIPCTGDTSARTARVVLQRSSLAAGTYSVMVTAGACSSNEAVITVATAVRSDRGAACESAVRTIGVNATVAVCQFSVP